MTTISTARHALLVSKLGPPNPLPMFQWQQPIALQDTPPSDKLSPKEVENAFIWGAASILPYQVQDNYDRAQQPGHLEAVFIENDFLKLTLYPQYGGRLASIFDKQKQRDLLFNNPVFQPANLAALNAWFSGGIEWNGLIPGHTPFTCSPVFTATVDTENGPILRLYEFDRIREATWQVDLYLPADEARLWVHIKIINPNPHPIKCYWWTNIATPLQKETRVLSPADYGIEHVLPDNHLEPYAFPAAHEFDGTYPANYPHATSVFFRKPGQERPWIATFQKDGRGMFNTSSKKLPARKLFVFGHKSGGQRWMDFLSLPGQGDYIEIQAGVAPTQNQEFIVAAKQSIEWTECIAPLAVTPDIGHQPDYQAACQFMERFIKTELPDDALAETDQWLQTQADTPIMELLQAGPAWGLLHQKMSEQTISPGLCFETQPTTESLWAELLNSGTFSEESLSQLPQSWAVSDGWVAVLEKSVTEYGTTWLHELLLGVARLDRGNIQAAEQHCQKSLQLKENYLAYRHLALIYLQQGDLPTTENYYHQAWVLSDNAPQLAVEICQFHLRENKIETLEKFLSQLPADTRQLERVRLAQAVLELAKNNFTLVQEILNFDFVTIREGETLLTDLWFNLHLKQAEAGKGSPLTDAEKAAVKAQHPLPYNIDFRMVTSG